MRQRKWWTGDWGGGSPELLTTPLPSRAVQEVVAGRGVGSMLRMAKEAKEEGAFSSVDLDIPSGAADEEGGGLIALSLPLLPSPDLASSRPPSRQSASQSPFGLYLGLLWSPGNPSSASLELTSCFKIDVLELCYDSVNFAGDEGPASPNWWAQID